jgi:glycosyltransferase involved in cell wall biosynthesis
MKKIKHVVCNPSTGVLSLVTSLVNEQSKNKTNDIEYSVIVIYDRNININEVDSALEGILVNKYYCPIRINTIFYFVLYFLTKFIPLFNDKNTLYHFHNAQMSAGLLHSRNKNNSLITIHGFPAFDDFMANPKGLIRNIHSLFFKRITKEEYKLTSVDMGGLLKVEKCFNIKLKNKIVVPNCTSSNYKFVDIGTLTSVRKFVFIGAIDENKGIEYIAQAFDESDFEYELHVFGIGGQLYSLIDRFKMNSKIFFYGSVQRSEVLKLLPNFDVYISFSSNEGFSMSFIEGLASGLAVISTEWGDVKEYIEGNGYLIKRDIEELKRVIEGFYKMDDNSLNVMKAASFQIFKSKLSPEIVSQRYQELYEG